MYDSIKKKKNPNYFREDYLSTEETKGKIFPTVFGTKEVVSRIEFYTI
jgi:hypothetical protein